MWTVLSMNGMIEIKYCVTTDSKNTEDKIFCSKLICVFVKEIQGAINNNKKRQKMGKVTSREAERHKFKHLTFTRWGDGTVVPLKVSRSKRSE